MKLKHSRIVLPALLFGLAIPLSAGRAFGSDQAGAESNSTVSVGEGRGSLAIISHADLREPLPLGTRFVISQVELDPAFLDLNIKEGVQRAQSLTAGNLGQARSSLVAVTELGPAGYVGIEGLSIGLYLVTAPDTPEIAPFSFTIPSLDPLNGKFRYDIVVHPKLQLPQNPDNPYLASTGPESWSIIGLALLAVTIAFPLLRPKKWVSK